jgi:lipoprotein-anchoring transpeptidase ErfK/SrfK
VAARRTGAVFIALTLTLALTGACKGPAKVQSFGSTITVPKTRVLTQSVSVPIGVPAPTRIALAAKANGAAVGLYASPDATATPTKIMANPTVEGVPLAFLAVDMQDGWYQVRVPERPNGTTAWVKADQVALTPVDNRVVISVGQRNLRVLDKNQQVLYETNVAVGKPATPTPLGRFYIDIWYPNPGSPYGSFLLSIAGFSDVLKSFGGGRGQIAMHGWSDPSVMGRNVSNGCVRMRNADISQVAALAPLGTPVEIVA